ncbi:hypothetical protein JAAARDRAFT_37596 [Jaapia argillacea MUCL 33604]|uniref:Uncharacterized protein n=1 Tax=Jaapia argillacea MUCL 33604 TaxID=933084 RepID=A0A067PUX0_9AGAM|nr:hypothetical protein JAAARDRAFT_37596 [Jaapia argillacea MUCL 33604]
MEPGSLPNLQEFSGSHDDALLVCTARPPVEKLGIFRVEEVNRSPRLVGAALQLVSGTLRRISWTGLEPFRNEVAVKFARCIPQLTAEWVEERGY